MAPNTAQGSCRPNEICVDGVHSPNRGDTAYCVSNQNIVKLASAQYGGQQRQVRYHPGDTSATANMVEVVLSGISGITSKFNAAHIKLEAQDASGKPIADRQAVDECDQCESIGIQPWPKGTDSFLATITMPNANDIAIAYFNQIVPGSGYNGR